jgi:DNA-directed RNA polymerase sigma subunit (sigma70/sigma32)
MGQAELELLERLHEAAERLRGAVVAERHARAEVYTLVRANADAGNETWAIAELLEVTTERVRQILAKTP